MPLRAAEHWARVITAALARVQRMLTVSQQLHVCYQAEIDGDPQKGSSKVDHT